MDQTGTITSGLVELLQTHSNGMTFVRPILSSTLIRLIGNQDINPTYQNNDWKITYLPIIAFVILASMLDYFFLKIFVRILWLKWVIIPVFFSYVLFFVVLNSIRPSSYNLRIIVFYWIHKLIEIHILAVLFVLLCYMFFFHKMIIGLLVPKKGIKTI